MGTGTVILFVFLYFLPTVVAAARKHNNGGPILLVNLFFGWSVIGWLVALIWSFTSNTKG